MVYTARQLEALLQSHGRIVLPYRARLTPLAQDWLRARKIEVVYADDGADASPPAASPARPVRPGGLPFLWWCDGPCGTAKAALTAVAKEANLAPLPASADASKLAQVLKHLSAELSAGRCGGGIVVVRHAGMACVLANRSSALRAVVGTSIASVDAALVDVCANVLLLESEAHSLMQMRNLISRFVRGQRSPDETLLRQLSDAARCECKH
jgi:hypothetical protein